MGGQTPTLIGQYLEIKERRKHNRRAPLRHRRQPHAQWPQPCGQSAQRLHPGVPDQESSRTHLIQAGSQGSTQRSTIASGTWGSSLDLAGTLYVALHSEGSVIVEQFPFNWNDGNFHTYRMVKSTSGNLVTLFIDTVLIVSSEKYSCRDTSYSKHWHWWGELVNWC